MNCERRTIGSRRHTTQERSLAGLGWLASSCCCCCCWIQWLGFWSYTTIGEDKRDQGWNTDDSNNLGLRFKTNELNKFTIGAEYFFPVRLVRGNWLLQKMDAVFQRIFSFPISLALSSSVMEIWFGWHFLLWKKLWERERGFTSAHGQRDSKAFNKSSLKLKRARVKACLYSYAT